MERAPDTGAATLASLAGRPPSGRADAKRTRERLVDGLVEWFDQRGAVPERLADVADQVGVSTATAYRHFASIDDVVQAFVLRLPVRAVERFESLGGAGDDPLGTFTRWNRSWVETCLDLGKLTVHLRSPRGFLERIDDGDPVMTYACSLFEPVLDALDGDTRMMLFMWNVAADPREVLDLHRLGWTPEQIANFITDATLATPTRRPG